MTVEKLTLFEWLQILTPVVVLIASALISVAAYFGKKTVDGYGEQLASVRDDHDALNEKFLLFQAQLPRIYVLKDDHIRHITIVEKKIDDLGNSVQLQLSDINSDVKLLLRETPKRRSDGTA